MKGLFESMLPSETDKAKLIENATRELTRDITWEEDSLVNDPEAYSEDSDYSNYNPNTEAYSENTEDSLNEVDHEEL